jgi:hypothetical protein
MREIPKCPKHKTYLAKREPTAECPACHKQFALTQAAAERIQRKMLSVLGRATIADSYTLDRVSSGKLVMLIDDLRELYTR